MVQAILNGMVVAKSDKTEVVEGNHYFAQGEVERGLLRPSTTKTTCPWKGEASYYDVVAGGTVSKDAAWTYPEPKPEAESIRGRIAFWKDVRVS